METAEERVERRGREDRRQQRRKARKEEERTGGGGGRKIKILKKERIEAEMEGGETKGRLKTEEERGREGRGHRRRREEYKNGGKKGGKKNTRLRGRDGGKREKLVWREGMKKTSTKQKNVNSWDAIH